MNLFRHQFHRCVVVAICLAVLGPAVSLAAPLCTPATGLNATQHIDILPVATTVTPWTNETPRALRSIERIGGRTALRAELADWSPISVDDNDQVNSSDFDAMEVWLRASLSSPPLSLISGAGVVCLMDSLIQLKANTWQRLQIPLSSLGYRVNQPIGRVKLKSQVREPYIVWATGWRLIKTESESEPPVPDPDPEDPAFPERPIDQPTTLPDIDLGIWRRDPGVAGEIDDHLPARRVRLLANGADNRDDTDEFQQALAGLPASGAILQIPAGTFYINSTLRLKSLQVLRGEGPERTKLIFTRSLNQAIEIGGGYPGLELAVYDAKKRSSQLTVRSHSSLRAGRFALLNEAGSASSQVIKIVSLHSSGTRTSLELEEPLNASFTANATLQTFDAAEQAGIENLTLDVASDSVKIGDMVLLRSAANSWMRNVVSRRAFSAHVFTRQSYHCEIRDSVFDDATGHHDGKQGYGIDLANSTTSCLVENNALRRLRHSILLQEGANGNVVALNHSAEPRHTNFARGGPGDISFHGSANANLIEANVVERIHIGDAGPVGSGNVVLRNCLTSGPLTLENVPVMQYLAGNAMYGSDAQLMNTYMPPVLPQKLYTRAYLEANSSLFDNDGIIFTSAIAKAPVALGNWYRNQLWSDGLPQVTDIQIPATLYSSNTHNFLAGPISGYWPDDCRIPALQRLSDYVRR